MSPVQSEIKVTLAHSSQDSSNMSLRQSIAWIGEQEARIWRVESGLHRESTIIARTPNTGDGDMKHDHPVKKEDSYFHRVARALDVADEILIVGPSVIKLDFVKYMHKDDHALDPRILGVETIESPNDAKLQGYAKLYFTDAGPRRPGNGSGHNGSE